MSNINLKTLKINLLENPIRRTIKIDNNFSRSVYIWDSKNNNGHDFVFTNKRFGFHIEGECLASYTIN